MPPPSCVAPRAGALCSVTTLLQSSLPSRIAPYLLVPCDVQAINACGVTLAVSLLVWVIEVQAGQDLSRIAPGSDEAIALKEVLQARVAWSQYMAEGLSHDAEVD